MTQDTALSDSAANNNSQMNHLVVTYDNVINDDISITNDKPSQGIIDLFERSCVLNKTLVR